MFMRHQLRKRAYPRLAQPVEAAPAKPPVQAVYTIWKVDVSCRVPVAGSAHHSVTQLTPPTPVSSLPVVVIVLAQEHVLPKLAPAVALEPVLTPAIPAIMMSMEQTQTAVNLPQLFTLDTHFRGTPSTSRLTLGAM